jgi:hypothetical protein
MSLSAPERIVALAVWRRQDEVRSRLVIRVERTFGRDGIALLAAGLALVMVGELLAATGVLLLPLSSAGTAGSVAGYIQLALAVALVVAGVIRIRQGLRVGRAFRAGGE